jgi:galactosylceramidase
MRRRIYETFVALAGAAIMAMSPAALGDQAFVLDGSAKGKHFDGIGAVSGGGATSVLLKDYLEPQRSQILDILFKPNFAASMQALYVEVGSDGNATQGTEPTHMRTRNDENYFRGYEWWLMKEAKKRNPAITLDACAWGAPGWIGDGEYWSQDMADYYVKWIKGLKTHHGLDLDAIGCRNERGDVIPWAKLFRRTLDQNGLQDLRIHGFDNPGNQHMWGWIPQLQTDKELGEAVGIISNHVITNGPWPDSVRQIIELSGKPLWNTEEHVYNGEGREYADEYACAIGALHLFNDNHLSRGVTKIVNWYLAGSTYSAEPYADQPPALFARWPWSGHYRIKPIIWAYAHYGQFTKVGWRYVPSGCAKLSSGGTIVTLKSDERDFSVIAETAGATGSQQVSFKIGPGLTSRALCVWRTTRDEHFIRQKDLTPGEDGTLSITLEPNAMYSFSTTTGQQKGTFDNVPDAKPFPFPYLENFDHYADARHWGYLPYYTADICGVFEIANHPDGGKCLRQVVVRKANSWAPEWMPYTIIGDEQWTDYEVSVDISLDGGHWAGVMGRISYTGNGWEGNPKGYYVRLYPDGACTLYSADVKYPGSRDKQLATGQAKPPQAGGGRWHNLKLRFEGKTITVLVNNTPVITTEDADHSRGMAGLIAAGEGNARHTAAFDNLLINRPNGGPVAPTTFSQDRYPIYGQ